MIGGNILHGCGSFAGEMTFIHGSQAWAALNYGDTERVVQMVSDLLAALGCVAAPHSTVLYGEFFTDTLVCALERRLRARFCGQFEMRLTWEKDIAPDMERGARALGLREMRALLRRMD